jgi:hypothetical protein
MFSIYISVWMLWVGDGGNSNRNCILKFINAGISTISNRCVKHMDRFADGDIFQRDIFS